MVINKEITRKLHIVILAALLLRVILTFAFQTDWEYMNPDEERSYTIAQNYLWGHGYALMDEYKHQWVQTAFHAPFNMFLYIKLQAWHIPKKIWVMFIHLLSMFLYALSATYFFKLAKEVLLEKFAFWATIVYLFFPSLIFYVGILFAYENITVPLLVIMAWQLLQTLRNQWKPVYWFTIPFTIMMSILVRPSMTLLYGILLASTAIVALRQKNFKFIGLVCTVGVITFLAHVPTFIKNHNQFGAYTLSNQTGYELLQGHSDVARGSWRGGWQNPDNPLYIYTKHVLPGIDTMNEYEGGQARERYAINWIRNNPVPELKLSVRKIGIFLLPKNYEVLPTYNIYNPINAVVYLLAVICFFMLLFRRGFSTAWMIIVLPFVGAVLLSLIFFVSYRVRFYAEPFMCLMALWPVQVFFTNRKIVQANS